MTRSAIERLVEDPDPPGGLDAVTWTWEIERRGQRRKGDDHQVPTLLGATGQSSADAALGRETKRRNCVEAMVDSEGRPRYRETNTAHSLADHLPDRDD